MSSVTPQALTRTVQDFRRQAAGAVVLGNGAVAFDLAQSKYSNSRLAVVELKADQDVHLLGGAELTAENRGFFSWPALHVHPAIDTLLRYFAPEIELEFLGIDELWREGVKVVFRKRA